MDGVVTGLDLAEAMTHAALIGAPERAALAHCLAAIEAGALAGIAKKSPD